MTPSIPQTPLLIVVFLVTPATELYPSNEIKDRETFLLKNIAENLQTDIRPRVRHVEIQGRGLNIGGRNWSFFVIIRR